MSFVLLLIELLQAQEPRKRASNDRFTYEEPIVLEQEDDVSCSGGGCVKRSPGQDEFGPFWANRGKKDPTYSRSKLYAEEPHWILVRRDDKDVNDNEPFYVARGKKSFSESNSKNIAAQFWRTLFGVNSPRKLKYLQNLGVPYFLEVGRKENGNERSADIQ